MVRISSQKNRAGVQKNRITDPIICNLKIPAIVRLRVSIREMKNTVRPVQCG